MTGDDLMLLPHFEDAAVGQHAAEVRSRVNDAIAAQHASGIDDGVASHLRPVADDGAELGQPRRNISFLRGHRDLAVIELHVGENHPGAEVRLVSENRVPHVIEMRHLRLIEEDAVLKLAGISENGAVPHDDVFPDITATADMTIFADPGWPF